MTNGEAIKFLQRFPPEGKLKVRRYDARNGGTTELIDVDRVEMVLDTAPVPLVDQNISWADLVKEKVLTVLVFGAPPEDRPTREPRPVTGSS